MFLFSSVPFNSGTLFFLPRCFFLFSSIRWRPPPFLPSLSERRARRTKNDSVLHVGHHWINCTCTPEVIGGHHHRKRIVSVLTHSSSVYLYGFCFLPPGTVTLLYQCYCRTSYTVYHTRTSYFSGYLYCRVAITYIVRLAETCPFKALREY